MAADSTLGDRLLPLAAGLFSACIPAIPYAPAAAFLGREKGKLVAREGEPHRVALVADGVGGMHGVTHTLDEIRERGVPGFEVEVIGTDANVDRRLPAVAEVDVPLYAGLKVGVPSLPATVEALAEGRYDLVHLCSPGPAGVAAALIARTMELPLVGSYHTELGVYAGLRSGDERLRAGMDMALAALYGLCQSVLSPSESADESLRALGIAPELVGRWDRGVDTSRFDPGLRDAGLHPGEVNVLYAGRLTKEKGVELLADAFLAARERDPRLHLVLAGGGPEEGVAARAPRRARHVPRLAGRRSARPRVRERRRVPVRQRHGHVRAGRARGPGQRAAGGGGRRGRPARADRGRADRPAARGPRGLPRRGGLRAGQLAGAAPPARPRRGWPPCAPAPGSAPLSSSPSATGAR